MVILILSIPRPRGDPDFDNDFYKLTDDDIHAIAPLPCACLQALRDTGLLLHSPHIKVVAVISPLSATLPMIMCLHDYLIHALPKLLLVLLVESA